MFESEGFRFGSEAAVWRKYLRHCWDFSAPLMIRRPGNCAPPVTPLFVVDNKNDGQVTSAFPSLSEQIWSKFYKTIFTDQTICFL